MPETQDDMGSTSDNSAGDWKTADVRKDSNEAGTSADAKTDEVELQDHDRARRDAAVGRRQFPRLGMDALLHESRPPSDDRNEDGSYAFYKVYKRRFFGLFQLTLLNVAVSWQVSSCDLSSHAFQSTTTTTGWSVCRSPVHGGVAASASLVEPSVTVQLRSSCHYATWTDGWQWCDGCWTVRVSTTVRIRRG